MSSTCLWPVGAAAHFRRMCVPKCLLATGTTDHEFTCDSPKIITSNHNGSEQGPAVMTILSWSRFLLCSYTSVYIAVFTMHACRIRSVGRVTECRGLSISKPQPP